jgi:lantibiotic modifying enzyme
VRHQRDRGGTQRLQFLEEGGEEVDRAGERDHLGLSTMPESAREWDAPLQTRMPPALDRSQRNACAGRAAAAVVRGLSSLACALAALLTSGCFSPPSVESRPPPPSSPRWLAAAEEAGRWIRSTARLTEHGTTWPADPKDPSSVRPDLYSGSAGVVLFFLELHRATGDASYLADARSGADHLAATLPSAVSGEQAGLYTGVAGIGFSLHETFKATREPRYRQAALRSVELLQSGARKAGGGGEWGETTDIISGGAGTGLFLLYAAREMGRPDARELASLAAERLVELARPEAGGLKWAMDPTFPRLMPNFSHGTAGIGYFLAALHAETGQRELLDAAVSAGRYLVNVARREESGCLVFHDEPDGKDLFYLGWCHGPPGTARLFWKLGEITQDDSWKDWARRSARSVLQSGVPESRTAGFWNNVGLCCGSAGIADFFLELHRATGDGAYLEFARRLSEDVLARATRDATGIRWIHAEHRVKPNLLVAQTGLMQGAAGIGLWLLRLDAFEKRRRPGILLPDSPFGS